MMTSFFRHLAIAISLLAGLVLVSTNASADHRHYKKYYGHKHYYDYHRHYRHHHRHYSRHYYPRRHYRHHHSYWSFYIGPSRYYYADNYYYRRHPHTQEYIVVDKPDGADEALQVAATEELYIYPKDGQSPERQDRDRYDCHVWATEQSGVDPTLAEVGTESILDYRRASTACLEGRGYTVK